LALEVEPGDRKSRLHQLLAEIGLSDAEIAELGAEGVIGQTPGGARTAARQ
jgi:hypothetical protein